MTDPVPALNGVFPVLATPFLPDGSVDAEGLRAIARYAIDAGADGVVYPGVASEFEMLALDERARLTDLVATEAAGRCALVVGASGAEPSTTMSVASRGREQGASALMVMAPKTATDQGSAIDFFKRVALAAGGVPIMLQNAD